MIRPAWRTSVALHAGVVGLLLGFSWAEPPVHRPTQWEVKLAVEPEQTPSPALSPPAAALPPQPESVPATPPAIAAPPNTPAAPLTVTAPLATPTKPTKRQALDPPPAQRRPKPPPVAPLAPAVLSETPRRPMKRDTGPSVAATPTKPVQRSGEDRATAGKAEPGAPFPNHAGATSGFPGEKTATPDLGRAKAWYAALIVKLREMRRYPPVARRLGQEGVVILAIEIGANGELRSTIVRRSSGSSLLDQAATHLIRDAIAALGSQLSPPGESRLEIPVAYRLDN